MDAMSSQDDLRRIALAEFSASGYGGTSLQRIAEIAGVSKSNVLYHFASKEVLLDAAIGPAIARLDEIVTRLESQRPTAQVRDAFVQEFVDFLLEHRLEVHTFINQGESLRDVPVVARAQALVIRLAQYLHSHVATIEDQMRFGIALGGAAYMLCSIRGLGIEEPPAGELRPPLVNILGELFAPIRLTD